MTTLTRFWASNDFGLETAAAVKLSSRRWRFVSGPQFRCSRNDKPYEFRSFARVSFTGASLGIQKRLGFTDGFKDGFVQATEGVAIPLDDGIGRVIEYHYTRWRARAARAHGTKGLFHRLMAQVVGHTLPEIKRGFGCFQRCCSREWPRLCSWRCPGSQVAGRDCSDQWPSQLISLVYHQGAVFHEQ